MDGPIHEYQQDADRQRQELLESLDLHVLRIPADEVAAAIDTVISRIERALPVQSLPSPSGRGAGGEGGTRRGKRPRVRYGK